MKTQERDRIVNVLFFKFSWLLCNRSIIFESLGVSAVQGTEKSSSYFCDNNARGSFHRS